MPQQQTVYVVDDNADDRHLLAFELGASGIEAWPFSSAEAFLTKMDDLRPELVLFAVELAPHWSLDFVSSMKARGNDWPLIALCRSCDVALAVETMKCGVIDFLPMPVDKAKLLSAVRAGATVLDARLRESQIREAAQARVAMLTARESSVCQALLGGQPNKVAAYNLGISVRTVEAHRSNIMMKLNVHSIAEVFMLMSQAGLAPHVSDATINLAPRGRRMPHFPAMMSRG
jgi:two-component system, LuxR family, response regulator FixJ